MQSIYIISLDYWKIYKPPNGGRAQTRFHVTLNTFGSLFKAIFDPLSVRYAKLQTEPVECSL